MRQDESRRAYGCGCVMPGLHSCPDENESEKGTFIVSHMLLTCSCLVS